MNELPNKKIVVIGGGGHAQVVISLIKKLNNYQLLGYTDPVPGPDILGARYLGDDQQLDTLAGKYAPFCAVLGVGYTSISEQRLALLKKLDSLGIDLPALISPAAVINENVQIGAGTVICDGVVVAAGSCIGAGCILNTASTIDHDCKISDGAHIAPGAVLCGGVSVGKLSMIGAGAVVIQARAVGDRCFVAAGATVTQDIFKPATYIGTPARPING